MKKAVICSERLPREAVKRLEGLFDRIFLLPSDKMLPDPVCHHPDMILSLIGKKLICHKKYFEDNRAFITEMCDYLQVVPVLSDCDRGEKYPRDIAFNALICRDHVFCKTDYASPELLQCAKEERLNIVNVNQGYAACSCLYADKTVITADLSILSAAKENAVSVLVVASGGIVLEPYDTGFIGGAAGYSDGVVYTFGELESYSGFKVLGDFFEKENISVVSLLDGALIDFGGIKIVTV